MRSFVERIEISLDTSNICVSLLEGKTKMGTSNPATESSSLIEQAQPVSLDLKLCPNTNLTVSLYHVESTSSSTSGISLHNELCKITNQLRDTDKNTNPAFAIMDARRIISLNQLVIAANMAFTTNGTSSTTKGGGQQNKPKDIWSVVLNVAGSTHFGHILRDYAFGEKEDESKSTTTMMIPTVAFSIGTTVEEHTAYFTNLLSSISNTLKCTIQPLSTLEKSSLPSTTDNANDEIKQSFIKWYKLTPKEIEATSLENAVLTKIATKFYV